MTKDIKVTIRLRPGQDDDLIQWFAGLAMPYGKKGESIKQAIRYGLNQGPGESTDKLDTGTLLADIRMILEATLQSSLVGLTLHATTVTEPEIDDTDDFLSSLDQQLLIHE